MSLRYEDFDELYRAHGSRLVLQLYAHTADLSLAQDCVQEAFCRALARWPRISRYEDPIGWVRRVAWNLAASHWRRLRRGRDHAASQPPPEPTAGPDPERVALVRALATLPDRQRRAVIMFYLGDLTLQAIADTEHVSTNTIKQRLQRARTSLAALLSDQLPEVRRA